jgi:hypothetical protein
MNGDDLVSPAALTSFQDLVFPYSFALKPAIPIGVQLVGN